MRWHNVLLLAAAILISGCKEEKLAVGAPAPALAAFDLQGQESGLERWQGKAVYLNFWSAGCGGCLAEMDTLEALSKKWGDKVVVVAVNTDPETVRINDLLDKTSDNLSGGARSAQHYPGTLSGDRHADLRTD